MDTKIEEPNSSRKKRMICCHTLRMDKLTVLRPAWVIADVTRNKESVYVMLRGGVDEPQKTMLASMQVPMK